MANKVIVNGLNIGYLPPSSSEDILYTRGGGISTKDKIDEINLKQGGDINGHVTLNSLNGTTSTEGSTYLNIGNGYGTGTDKNSTGIIRLFSSNGKMTTLYSTASNVNKTIRFPDNDGILALTSDLGVCDTLLEVQNIPTTATLYNCNWQNYYFLSIEATFYNNVMEQMIIPTSYFAITAAGARPQIYDSLFSCMYQVYKHENGKVYIFASKSDTNRGIRIYGIMKKPV